MIRKRFDPAPSRGDPAPNHRLTLSVSAVSGCVPVKAHSSERGGLPPHRSERAELPHSVPQARLPGGDQKDDLSLRPARLFGRVRGTWLLDIRVSAWFHQPMRRLVSPFPRVGRVAAPSPRPCASPPSSVLWGRKTAPYPSQTPPVSLGARYLCRRMPLRSQRGASYPVGPVRLGGVNHTPRSGGDRELSQVPGESL